MQWPFCVHLALLLDYYKKAAFCLQVSVSVSIFDLYQILKKYHMKKILLCFGLYDCMDCDFLSRENAQGKNARSSGGNAGQFEGRH